MVNNLRFADDIVLLAGSMDDLRTMLQELNSAAKSYGLQMNAAKTKIMANSNNATDVDLDNNSKSMCTSDKEYPSTGTVRERRYPEEFSLDGQHMENLVMSLIPNFHKTLKHRFLTSVSCRP